MNLGIVCGLLVVIVTLAVPAYGACTSENCSGCGRTCSGDSCQKQGCGYAELCSEGCKCQHENDQLHRPSWCVEKNCGDNGGPPCNAATEFCNGGRCDPKQCDEAEGNVTVCPPDTVCRGYRCAQKDCRENGCSVPLTQCKHRGDRYRCILSGASEGQRCLPVNGDLSCEYGLDCVRNGTVSRCRRRANVDEPCTGYTLIDNHRLYPECQARLVCVSTNGTSQCKRKADLGEACTGWSRDPLTGIYLVNPPCLDYLVCVTASGSPKCHKYAEETEPCTSILRARLEDGTYDQYPPCSRGHTCIGSSLYGTPICHQDVPIIRAG